MGNHLVCKKQKEEIIKEETIKEDTIIPSESCRLDELGKERIREFVKKMLERDDINVAFIPDSVEAKLYESLLAVLIYDIKEVIESVNIKLLNFEIKLSMKPIENDKKIISIEKKPTENHKKI